MHKEKFVVISKKNYRDALRPTLSTEDSEAVLLNLKEGEKYKLVDNALYKEGTCLLDKDILKISANWDINKPLKHNALLYALYSYLFLFCREDIENQEEVVLDLQRLCKYMGIASDAKSYEMVAKLKSFETVLGFIADKGVYRLLEIVKLEKNQITIKCPYFHRLVNVLIAKANMSDQKYYHTTLVLPKMFSDKNQMAILIAVELAVLTATMVQKGKRITAYAPKRGIRGEALICRIPELREFVIEESRSVSIKNRKLKRAFERAYDLYSNCTECYLRYESLEITRTIPTLKTLDRHVIITCEKKEQ